MSTEWGTCCHTAGHTGVRLEPITFRITVSHYLNLTFENVHRLHALARPRTCDDGMPHDLYLTSGISGLALLAALFESATLQVNMKSETPN
jgi:hypothetical protein